MINVKVSLQPLVTRLNLPTVLKTAMLPGDSIETLFIATQVGEIYYIGNEGIRTFLDIRPRIIALGVSSNGYDERGLLGLAFHPNFHYNGLFYLHYSVAETQGPGALTGDFESFIPNPCEPKTLNLKWLNREIRYDHIDTVEEWVVQSNGQPLRRRTLLNIRRPFMNHNGVNSLNFSPETGKLVLTTGDGGSGYDPFNLSQDNMEIAGKIIEIDVTVNTSIDNPPVVTRFNELPVPFQTPLTLIAKGVRNIPGISYQKFYHHYIKYVGIVGQDLVESIYSFVDYKPIPVTELTLHSVNNTEPDQQGFINFGWRGWEGAFPTSVIRGCSTNTALDNKTIAYYDEAVETLERRLQPLMNYYHKDPRSNKFEGTALTGVQPYMGSRIPELTGSVVFTDLAQANQSQAQAARGALAYTGATRGSNQKPYSIIETDYDFGTQPAYYVSLGTNLDQSRLYLGVYRSTKVADSNQGTVFEIVP